MSLICKIIEGNIVKLPLKKGLSWTGATATRPQIAGDKSADACFPASQILMITPLFYVLCEWFAGAWSAAQSFKNGSILTSPHEGTLRLKNCDLWHCSRNWPSSDKPFQIASLIYSWPLLPLSPLSIFPSPQGQRSVLLDKVAEQLSCYCLPTSHPALQASCLHPSAPVVQSHFRYTNDYIHLPAAPWGLEGKEHVDNTKGLQIKEIQGSEIPLKPKGIQLSLKCMWCFRGVLMSYILAGPKKLKIW